MSQPRRASIVSLERLFDAYRPSLESTLGRYWIPPPEAAALLEEVVLELIYKGEVVEGKPEWLAARLRRKCRLYWVERRRELSEAVGRTFTDSPARIAGDGGDHAEDAS